MLARLLGRNGPLIDDLVDLLWRKIRLTAQSLGMLLLPLHLAIGHSRLHVRSGFGALHCIRGTMPVTLSVSCPGRDAARSAASQSRDP